MSQCYAQTISLTLVVLVNALLGCSTAPRASPATESTPPLLIAVLPFENHSNDVDAPQKVRTALFEKMNAREFRLLELDKIDSALRNVSVTLGSQLELLENRREVLNGLIPADVYCYGTVVEFAFKNAVALTQRKVELKLRLVDAKTGAVLFEGTEMGITTKAGLDAAADATLNTAGKVAKSVKDSVKQFMPGETTKQAADLTDVIADVDLTQETSEAIRKLLARFPPLKR